MVNDYLVVFREYLRKNGLRFTPERKAILEGVFALHKHFDVDELYEKLHYRHRHISRASIYRTLPFLVKSGLIKETLRCQGRSNYEHIFGHKHHDHLVCLKCGKVVEFVNDEIEKLQNDVCKEYNFQPVEHRLGIRGYCKECRSSKDRRKIK
ncbi:MAG: Fur family transcriptional regulator [Elusimicrobiota bacterium]